MLIPQVWLDLADYGLVTDSPERLTGSLHLVSLRGAGWPEATWRLHVHRGRLQPASLRAWITDQPDDSHPLLILAGSATRSVLAAAERAGVSVLLAPAAEASPTTGVLLHPDGPRLTLDVARAPEAPRPPGRTPWVTYAVAFELLAGPPLTQVRLAADLGVSQPRVSQVLAALGQHVRRGAGGWQVHEPGRIFTWLVERYPRTSLSTTWSTLVPVVAQAGTLASSLGRRGVRHAVTAQVAADVLAPWSNPTHLTIVTDRLVDLVPDGLEPATVRGANVTVEVSEDPFVLRGSLATDAGYRVLAPWRCAVDLARTGSHDAAGHLVETLLSGRLA